MSAIEPETQPTGEEIHLPGPSVLPLLLTVGVTLMVLGITLGLVLVIGGGIITLGSIFAWVRTTHHDVGELPPHH